MGIITPTFADYGKLHVDPAHEPIRGEAGPALVHVIDPGHQDILRNPTPVPEVKPLKVAIIGTAPSSRHLAPFGDPTWTIWACSPGNMNQIPRFDLWFEIHSNLLWPEHESYGKPYIKWLQDGDFPVVMQDNSLVTRASPYPILEMCERFGDDDFSSSFSYMMALAISHGAQEIALYGVDMASRDEYVLQRPGGRHFINTAKKLGIKVTIPYESDLGLPTPLYGYTDSTPAGRKLASRDTEIKGRIAGMQGELQKLQQNTTYLQGAAEDLDYMRNIQLGGENERILLRAKVRHLEAELAALKNRS